MTQDFKERIKAFSELGTLFKENIDEKENKNFPKWDLILEDTLFESKSYNSWFTIENLKLSLKNWSNSLQENIISDWLSKYNIEDKSSKRIAIIMAGNIPIVGFHDLLCSLLLNFDCLVKLSSDDKLLIPFIVRFLESRNKKFKNKVTIIQIMGSWCPNCMDETNYLTSIYPKYKDNLEIIGVGFETGKTQADKINAFYSRNK